MPIKRILFLAITFSIGAFFLTNITSKDALGQSDVTATPPAQSELHLEEITVENIQRLERLAIIEIDNIFFSHHVWSSDATILVVSGWMQEQEGIWLFDTSDWTQPPQHMTNTYVSSLAAHPYQNILAGQDGCVIYIWNINTATKIAQYTAFPPDIDPIGCTIWGMNYSADGSLFAAVNRLGVWVWDTTTNSLIASLPSEAIPNMTDCCLFAHGLAFSPDGHLIAFPDPILDRFYVWGIEEGLSTLEFNGEWQVEEVRQIAFHPTQNNIVITANGGHIGIPVWDIDTGKMELYLEGHMPNDGGMVSLTFNRDGTLVAASSIDGWLEFWTIDNPQTIHQIPNAQVSTSGFTMAFAPSFTMLSLNSRQIISIWGVVDH